MRPLRVLALLLPLALGAIPLPAQDLPARPASVGVRLESRNTVVQVREVLPNGPAARAGIRVGDQIVAVDGHPVRGQSAREEAWLVGALGDTVRLGIASGADTRTVGIAREDVFAPGGGYTEAVTTAHLVVHHRPGRAARIFAERLAARTEAFARTELRGIDTEGRRVHLYLVEGMLGSNDLRRTRLEMLPAWARWMEAGPFRPEGLKPVTAFLRFGAPGEAAAEHLGARQGWSAPADRLHREAVEAMLRADLPADAAPDLLLRMTTPLPELSASLRAYVGSATGTTVSPPCGGRMRLLRRRCNANWEFRRRSW